MEKSLQSGEPVISKKATSWGSQEESLTQSYPTIWGTIREPALWVNPGKTLSILQYGEILKKESAAVNTLVTTLWGIFQNVVTTHVSDFRQKSTKSCMPRLKIQTSQMRNSTTKVTTSMK